MPDREKVINGIEMCISSDECSVDKCPYYIRPNNESGLCWDRLMKDALALLKEQESMQVKYSAIGGLRYGACPKCNARVDNLVNPKACGFCGQELKWE